MCSIPVYAIEFYQCIDSEGQSHFTNLPKSTLDSDCRPKNDQYMVMLNQDYQNLENEFLKYETSEEETFDILDVTLDSASKSISELFDADMALEELLENTQDKRNNFATDFFKARTEAVESILSEENPVPPDP